MQYSARLLGPLEQSPALSASTDPALITVIRSEVQDSFTWWAFCQMGALSQCPTWPAPDDRRFISSFSNLFTCFLKIGSRRPSGDWVAYQEAAQNVLTSYSSISYRLIALSPPPRLPQDASFLVQLHQCWCWVIGLEPLLLLEYP